MIILSKNQVNVLDEIEQSLATNPRFKKQTKKAAFRASEVGYFCARKFALEKLFPARGDSAPSLASVVPLVLGSGIHHGLQNELLGDMLLGRWRCNNCGETSAPDAFEHRPRKCEKIKLNQNSFDEQIGAWGDWKDCESDDFTYIEETLSDEEGLIAGHPDGYLQLKSGEVVLVEIKTIGLGPHKSLDKGPLEAHVLQANIYLHLGTKRHQNALKINPENPSFPEIKRCVILYVIKHEHGLRVFREFTIEHNPTALEETLAKLREAATWVKGSELPDRICDSEKCKTAKYCPMAVTCFRVK